MRRARADGHVPPGFAGLRRTRQRLSVLQVVESLGVFCSARVVHEALDGVDERVSLSTVYRSLQLLEQHEMLDSIRGRDGEMLYRRCAGGRHHHLVCRHCGAAVEMRGGAVRRLVLQWAMGAGYRDVEHVLEAFGTCPDCAAESPQVSK